MSVDQLEEHREAAYKNIKNGWEYLQFLEKNSIHRPRDVVKIGQQVMNKNLVPSANRWRLLERIAICSLELNEIKMAKQCIEELFKKFTGQSKRTRILTGMYYECKEEYDKAEELYNAVLLEDGNHMMALKRKIAICITKKELNKAIKLLCKYLELYCNDREAWKQLSQIYLQQHNYDLAKFCVEELILMVGEDYLLHLHYADLLYNIGGTNNISLSLKYYAQSVMFGSDDNVRALWGIVMCIRSLRNTGSENENPANQNSWLKKVPSQEKELLKNCREKIMNCYAKKNSSLVDIIKDCLLQFDENE